MEDLMSVGVPIVSIFIGLPWVIMHYITKWKQAPKITEEDERLLDELQMLARRLEDRVVTVERIIAADNPDWKPGLTSQSYLADREPERATARTPFERRN
ncbi:envelope stress response membrane protein PspB [Sphingomonas ginsenosidivorax]|jgi:phage shock protein B|uniref:Envelope stress response membrane protein PspB n=1 Tax=Sphingomonas ginsenosidivorax TaxID=862135 RepID=A0A5C6UFK7_9SPHN|nr:envelope stress response membrane protein PspB [Sphingomonas ginsenosidivorax]TXC70926.1 envelope stress response membrane protein PspB [Sphingomonas ginsenosidivorax]